jgi:hypothetical protein
MYKRRRASPPLEVSASDLFILRVFKGHHLLAVLGTMAWLLWSEAPVAAKTKVASIAAGIAVDNGAGGNLLVSMTAILFVCFLLLIAGMVVYLFIRQERLHRQVAEIQQTTELLSAVGGTKKAKKVTVPKSARPTRRTGPKAL